MPQLDINTFSYQYVGIIVLVLIVYIILSYIVLPILLRLMLVRNLFLLNQQKVADLLQLSNFNYQQIILTHKPLYTNFLTGAILNSAAKVIKNFISLLTTTLSGSSNLTSSVVKLKYILTTDLSLSYLILLLSNELEENE